MNNKAQFTPGPWNVRHYRVAPTNCQWVDVTDSTGGLITHVPSSKGNAALIAAAPAMYEALQVAHTALSILPIEAKQHLAGNAVSIIENAIAQAEGRPG